MCINKKADTSMGRNISLHKSQKMNSKGQVLRCFLIVLNL